MTVINLGIRQRESLLEPLEAAVWLLVGARKTHVWFADGDGNYCAVGALARAVGVDPFAGVGQGPTEDGSLLNALRQELFYAIPRTTRDKLAQRALDNRHVSAPVIHHFAVVDYSDGLDKDGVVEWASFALAKVRARCG